MNKRRKLLSVLLSLALILSLMPALSIPARAAQEPVKYMDASVDPTTHAVTFTEKECTNYSVVKADSNYLSDGWYVVKGTVTLTRSLCQGTVNLILCDGAKLTAERGIITSGNTLNIYCQKEGTGELVAYGTASSKSAGIGGNTAGLGQAGPGGTVTINGGVITAVGGGQYAGIGGTKANSGGTVTINGGTVTATGGENAAGIGGGANGGGGTVTINGGTVEATGGSGAAGIGGGYNAGGGTVAIYGGTVTATGGSDAVGIGGGQMKTTESTLILGEGMALFGGSTASSTVLVPKGDDGSYARATSMKVQIAPVTPYNVWIGGVEVTSDNSSGTGWSYDSGSNTLTLNGYQYSGDGYKYASTYGGYGGNYAAIYAKQDLTISLTGESTVTNTVGEKGGYNENNGVFVDGKLTIQGEGQVTVNGKTAGIRSKSLQIDSGTVNASGDGEYMSDGSIVVTENGLTINGGTVTANGKKGIVVENGDVSITGGTVNAVGSGYQGSGIFVANGDITILGGEVTAISTSTTTNSAYRNGIVVNNSGKKLTIGASVTSVTLSGTDGAVRGYVVNAVAGIGWDNKEGTGTATDIGISNTARKLNDNIKKAQFPAPPAYMEATVDETTHEVTFSKKICTDYTKVASNTTTWSDGWYVVKGEVSIGTITVNGTANLILCDGAKLTSSGQIKVEGSNVLNIYGQSAGSGSLSVKAGKNDYVAGIGGQSGKTGGTISIHGGIVTATPDNSSGGVGIGGVDGGAHVTIYGGTVTATGGRGAGIGSSKSGNGGEVTIYGGTVTASSSSSAGIGGGHGCAGSTVTIYGGTVVANGGDNGAGIGGGGYAYTNDNSGGTVTIYGGNVTATGGSEYGAGIGGGYQGAGADVTILGGTVNATGGKFAAGIGGGSDSSGGGNGVGGTVTISGGTVTATGGNSSAEGIGKGQSGASSGTLTLDAGMYLYKDSVSDDNAVKKNDDGDYARSTTMIVNNVSPHTHKLTYSYSETAVTAVCDGDKSDFCEFPLVDGKHTATLTIAVPEKGGDPATADISGAAAFDETKISAITYETKQSDGTFAASAATPPEADGFHRASLTYTDGEGAHVISVTYGLNCITYGEAENGTVSGVKSAAVGAAITPTITPATGYEFDALTVAQKDNESVTVDVAADNSFVMPEYDVTVSATFKLKDFAVINGLTAGTMTAKVGENEVTTANMGDSVALTITPAAGYAVNTVSVKDSAEGSVDVSGENGSYSFTMPASDVTVTVTYIAIDYTVTVSETTNGTVVASKTTGAHVGDEITLTITPAAGYEFGTLSVKDEDENDVAVTDNKFTMPANAVTVTATFAAIDYTLTINSAENGTVTTTTTGAVHIGDKVTLTITPEENYGLKSVTTTAGALAQTALDEDTGVLTYELTVGAGDATVTAEFDELTTYTVFYNASGTPDAVSVKLEGGEKSYAMTNNAKLGNINCWSTQIKSGKGIDLITLSFKQSGSGEWTTLNISVADSIPNSLDAGKAVAIEGEAEVFVIAFVWGEDTNTQSRYYLATSNTESIDVPNPANTESENFSGWRYLVPSAQAGGEAAEKTVSKSSGASTTVSLADISETTIVSAVWAPKQYTVSFNPDNGSAATSQNINYGNKVTKPADPTKEGYEFTGWVLANTAVEKAGDNNVQLSAGTVFDFENISVINNLSLKAKWKHVHSYACLQLDNPVFGGAFSAYYEYKGQIHIKICTSMDEYFAEAHSFVNGKCACGASILDDKVTLTKYVNGAKSEMKAVKNSVVTMTAPQNQGGKIFSKWQYSSNTTDGQNGNWYDLSAMRTVSFTIPANLSVRAVYENEPFKLTINSFKYGDKHVAFQFNYSVPDRFTVVDGGLMLGDNVRMKFWDCTIKSFLGSQYEPSLRDAVKVFGGGTIANKMLNYETINEPGLAKPIKKPLASFGKTGTVALAWQTYDSAAYSKALNTKTTIKGYDQNKYPTYAMGYIICRDNKTGAYVGFTTNAISATLENPSKSAVTTVPVA